MGEALGADESTRTNPDAVTGLALPGEGVTDWQTIDPAVIRGNGLLVEELLTYREKLDELLKGGPGQFVLIVGREIIDLFPDLESAARHAAEHFRGKEVLIKKVEAVSSIRTLGGAMLESAHATVDVID